MEGLNGEPSVATIYRLEGIAPALYYRWCKDFLEAGKKRLMGDTMREANTNEVKELKGVNSELKEAVAELLLQNRVLKKSTTGFKLKGVNICVLPNKKSTRLFDLWKLLKSMLTGLR